MEKINEYMETLGMEIEHVGTDEAIASITHKQSLTNYYGCLHGGVYFSLADSAAGLAARSNGDSYVTLNASMNFIQAVHEGTIYAHARVLHRTRKTCVIEVHILNDRKELINSGTFTMYKVKNS